MNRMSVAVPQGERVPIERSSTYHWNENCHDRGHNTERIHEDSLLEALVDEVEKLHQQNVFTDLFSNVDRAGNEPNREFGAHMDQKRPHCGVVGYIDPVLDDPQRHSVNAGLFQVSNTIRPPDMHYGRLTGDYTNENSEQIIPSKYRMGSGVQENLAGSNEEQKILELHRQLNDFAVVQQQLHRQNLLNEEKELIKQIAQESAIKEAVSTLMRTENVDPVVPDSEKPYECGQCGVAFRRKRQLAAHQRTHSGERPFRCQICFATFKQSQYLHQHNKWNHTNVGESPLECHICQIGFRWKWKLSHHMKIHSSEMPYKCNVCKEAFRRKSCLSDHLEIHSGTKPYKCNMCEKAFRRKKQLWHHRKIHAREEE